MASPTPVATYPVRDVKLARRILLGGACFVALVVIVLFWTYNAPPVRIQVSGETAKIDVQTLGECPTTVTRITVASKEDGIVLDLRANADYPQMREISFHAGRNSPESVRVNAGAFQLIVPREGGVFPLRSGREYHIRVWNGVVWNSGRFTLGAS
ncbi:MAG TPA: hypothetical protein VGN16_24755 [Acidobacteriaceae bacterium]|jgi:hypothetical protein